MVGWRISGWWAGVLVLSSFVGGVISEVLLFRGKMHAAIIVCGYYPRV